MNKFLHPNKGHHIMIFDWMEHEAIRDLLRNEVKFHSGKNITLLETSMLQSFAKFTLDSVTNAFNSVYMSSENKSNVGLIGYSIGLAVFYEIIVSNKDRYAEYVELINDGQKVLIELEDYLCEMFVEPDETLTKDLKALHKNLSISNIMPYDVFLDLARRGLSDIIPMLQHRERTLGIRYNTFSQQYNVSRATTKDGNIFNVVGVMWQGASLSNM